VSKCALNMPRATVTVRDGATIYISAKAWEQQRRMSTLPRLHSSMAAGVGCWVQPLDSLVSGLREYHALQACHRSALLPYVLRPVPSQRPGYPDTPPSCGQRVQRLPSPQQAQAAVHEAAETGLASLPLRFVEFVRSTFNPAQQRAIGAAAAVDARGFTLIQGPPGTGKTTTLMGVLNAIHVREYNRYYDAVLSCALQGLGGDDTAATAAYERMSQAKPRLLVVAPSNVAVDQIIQRIMTTGFRDGGGSGESKIYHPHLVRFGRGQGRTVRPVSLDVLVEGVFTLSPKEVRAKSPSTVRVCASNTEAIGRCNLLVPMIGDSRTNSPACHHNATAGEHQGAARSAAPASPGYAAMHRAQRR
jgi:hypothetical protein